MVVAVVALSVGFAAFADDLTIDGTATVNASGNAFDATAGTDLRYRANSAKCYLTSDTTKTAVSGAVVGTLTEDAWSGISLPLGSTANSITCEAIVENNSSYTAYLKSLAANGGLACVSSGDNASVNEAAICKTAEPWTTTLTVTIDSDNSASDTITVHNAAVTNSSTTGSIAANSTATVTVTVAYTGATIDDDVTITLPTITHHYSSAH